MPLTDIEIKTARYGAGKNRRFDGHGLSFGSSRMGQLWRWKYRVADKETALPLGTYPEVSLKQAREACEEARQLLRRGVDPALKRKVDKVSTGTTFDAVAAEYLKLHEHEQSATTQRKAGNNCGTSRPNISAPDPSARSSRPKFSRCSSASRQPDRWRPVGR